MAEDPLVLDTENRQNPKALQTKVTYAGDEWNGQPYSAVTESGLNLVAGKDVGLSISSEFGTVFGGPFSLALMPDQFSIGGGYWRFNPVLLSTIPSTTPTPVPTLIKDTPNLLKAKPDVDSALGFVLDASDIVGL